MRFASGRTAPLVVIALLSTLAGCSGDSETATGGPAGSTSSSGGGGNGGGGGDGGGGGSGGGLPVCKPGSTDICYTGPKGTEIIGACKPGVTTCLPDGSGYGPCEGEVTPSSESCATMADDDCDGQVNEDAGCVCEPGHSSPCYSGPPGTQGIGICYGGLHECNPDGLTYGPCTQEMTPLVETCATPEDEDCDGKANEEGAECVCVPGDVSPCYSGPPGTENVGVCKPGVRVCEADGKTYSQCSFEVVPKPETCMTPQDEDCDGQVNEEGAGCVCLPNSIMSCYSGPSGTLGVGPCKAGTRQCNAQGTWSGPCIGETVPVDETCNTPEDDNCNGQVNEAGAGCVCAPNSTATCYSGPPGTAGVGLCKLGMATCNGQGTAYGPCVGEVTPAAEDCATPADESCGLPEACGTFGWSKSFGDLSEQDGLDIAADAAGNIYVTGSFMGSIDLGGGLMTSAGSNDVLVAKYSSTGAHLWSKRIGNASDQQGRGIAVDAAGDVYVTGYFVGSLDFGGGALTSAGSRDMFILKLSSAGNHVMSKRFGGLLEEEGAAIAVDSGSNIAVTGTFKSTLDFGGGALTSAGGDDIFVARLDAAGNHVFSKSYGDPGNQDPRDVAVDASGNVLMIGFFNGTIDLGVGPMTSSNNDIVIAKLSPAGSLIFGKSFGAFGSDIGHSVAADGAGNIYAAGYVQGAVDFGGGPLPTAGANDAFLVKLDSAGGHLWSKSFTGTSDQLGFGIAVDAAGNVVCTGRFQNSIEFNGNTHPSAGQIDIFLAKLDATGALEWSKAFGDSLDQIGRAVAVDGAGAVSLIGRFQGTVDFGGGPHSSAGANDGFIAHFAP
jgi:hypothetical protein